MQGRTSAACAGRAGAALLWFLMGVSCVSEALAQVQEHELKAAFIYNFISFTEWPIKIEPNVNVCTMGKDPLIISLDALQKKIAKGGAIVVHHLRAEDEVKDCHVIFISDSERSNFPKILSRLKSMSILTVTDSEGFAAQGVMIELALEERRIVFKINVQAAKQAKLMISSKLLRLAKVVY